MKGNKKILAVAILLLLISVGFTTYAIYKSQTEASGTVKLSGWHVEVQENDITSSPATTTLTFDLSSCTVPSGYTNHGEAGTFAPGDACDIVIPVDLTGSQVDSVDVLATLGTVTIDNGGTPSSTLPTGLTVALKSGDEVAKNVPYAASDMGTTITVEVRWTTNNTTQNASDVAAAGSDITIPVTLTATQHAYNA